MGHPSLQNIFKPSNELNCMPCTYLLSQRILPVISKKLLISGFHPHLGHLNTITFFLILLLDGAQLFSSETVPNTLYYSALEALLKPSLPYYLSHGPNHFLIFSVCKIKWH